VSLGALMWSLALPGQAQTAPAAQLPTPALAAGQAPGNPTGASGGGFSNAAPITAVVYRCPGTPVLYTDQLSPREAQERGCRTIDGAPITIVPAARPRTATPVAAAPATTTANAVPNPANRIDPAEQRARDTDARRILEAELRKEEERLAAMQREFNNGEPERRGDERNYQKYVDRVTEMRAAISRKESDVAAIRREIAKLAPAGG
jgi:hypothetical protein